ncbi:MAG TPA: hypothetical protein VF656_02420 [Pyrinomonadaceae bacterium]
MRIVSTRICATFISLLLLGVCVAPTTGAARLSQQPRGGRLMPPPALQCDRNELTSYDGRIIAYRRRRGSTFLRIRTNFDTTEEVTIRHPGTDDPSKFYLLNGRPFTKSDWRRIERRNKILTKNMRANVWVCRDNPSVQPVVDWQPDDTGAYPRSR